MNKRNLRGVALAGALVWGCLAPVAGAQAASDGASDAANGAALSLLPAIPDGSQSAVEAVLASEAMLLDVARAGERLVAVGAFGHVLLSDDDGTTWRQAQSVPTRVMLTDVKFASPEKGWAVGHDLTILHTADGGETWADQYHDTLAEAPFLSIHMMDERRGMAFGAFAITFETTDGGQTWVERDLISGTPVDSHLNAAFPGPDNSVFIAAEFGFVFRSLDGGETFEEIQTPYEGSFWGGMGLQDGSILVYGMRGNVWRSQDLGASWSQVETGTKESLSGGYEFPDGTVVLAGLGGAVAVSKDGSQSFETSISTGRTTQAAVTGLDAGTVLIFGETGINRKVLP